MIVNTTKTVLSSGNEYHYNHDQIHRDYDLPAIITIKGDKFWYQNGKCHRENNPAVIKTSGEKEYWIDGVQYSEQEFNMIMDKNQTASEINQHSQEEINSPIVNKKTMKNSPFNFYKKKKDKTTFPNLKFK